MILGKYASRHDITRRTRRFARSRRGSDRATRYSARHKGIARTIITSSTDQCHVSPVAHRQDQRGAAVLSNAHGSCGSRWNI